MRQEKQDVDWAYKFIKNYTGLILFSGLLVVSGVLLLLALRLEEGTMLREITRDIGLGFLVASVVGGIYDLHARSHFDQKTISSVLSTVIGDVVRRDIWEEVRKQVIEKDWLRENLHVKLELRPAPDADLEPNEMLLWLQMRYEVCNLRATRRRATVHHRLDTHHARGPFPRYTHARINDRAIPLDGIADGVFEHELDLLPRDGTAPRVLIEREELVYVPGTYVLTMGSLVKRLSIELEGIPESYQAVVLIRPHRSGHVVLPLRQVLDRELEDILLLPGQVLEFRFLPVAKPAVPVQMLYGAPAESSA